MPEELQTIIGLIVLLSVICLAVYIAYSQGYLNGLSDAEQLSPYS
jgi:hypothetical protein